MCAQWHVAREKKTNNPLLRLSCCMPQLTRLTVRKCTTHAIVNNKLTLTLISLQTPFISSFYFLACEFSLSFLSLSLTQMPSLTVRYLACFPSSRDVKKKKEGLFSPFLTVFRAAACRCGPLLSLTRLSLDCTPFAFPAPSPFRRLQAGHGPRRPAAPVVQLLPEEAGG